MAADNNYETLAAELWLSRNLTQAGMYKEALPLAVHARSQSTDKAQIKSAELILGGIVEDDASGAE
jgi:hypothetical protein